LRFTHAWERPAKALLDYFHLSAVDWLGASCGGYLALRAAAFEPRIQHVVSLPATYWGLDMALRQMSPGRDRAVMSLFRVKDREGVESIVAEQRRLSTNFSWAITQGMHITRTETAFDCLVELSKDDHLFDTDWVYRIMRELTCARSVTARIFTAREGAEQHCQVGNSALARDEMIRWLAKFHPGMEQRVLAGSAK
jgi:hypothetical protein